MADGLLGRLRHSWRGCLLMILLVSPHLALPKMAWSSDCGRRCCFTASCWPGSFLCQCCYGGFLKLKKVGTDQNEWFVANKDSITCFGGTRSLRNTRMQFGMFWQLAFRAHCWLQLPLAWDRIGKQHRINDSHPGEHSTPHHIYIKSIVILTYMYLYLSMNICWWIHCCLRISLLLGPRPHPTRFFESQKSCDGIRNARFKERMEKNNERVFPAKISPKDPSCFKDIADPGRAEQKPTLEL